MSKRMPNTKTAATVQDLPVRDGSDVKAGKGKSGSWFEALAKALGEVANEQASKVTKP